MWSDSKWNGIYKIEHSWAHVNMMACCSILRDTFLLTFEFSCVALSIFYVRRDSGTMYIEQYFATYEQIRCTLKWLHRRSTGEKHRQPVSVYLSMTLMVTTRDHKKISRNSAAKVHGTSTRARKSVETVRIFDINGCLQLQVHYVEMCIRLVRNQLLSAFNSIATNGNECSMCDRVN